MRDEPWGAGDVIGHRYRLDALIGRGGFGEVWRATDTKRDRQVAIKVLLPHPDADDDENQRERERFLDEARETSLLEGGPAIIPIYDWDDHDGRPYLVMPYDPGQPLGRVTAGRPLAPDRAVRIVAQVADALEYAHEHGRVHRDVKPSNVLVRRVGDREHVRLVDFGIVGLADGAARVRRTRTGVVIGSLAYMAPERLPLDPEASVHPIDVRFDVYGLGCLLHECLTGTRAFRGQSELEFARAHRDPRRPRPGGGTDPTLIAFDEVVGRALEIDIARRTPTAAAFRAQMQEALDGWLRLTERPVPVRSPSLVVESEPTLDPAPVRVPDTVPGPAPSVPEPRPAPAVAVTEPVAATPVAEPPAPVAGAEPVAASSRWSTAASAGAVTGIVGCVVSLVAGLDLTGDVVLIAASWVAGAGGGYWWSARRTSGGGPSGVSTPPD